MSKTPIGEFTFPGINKIVSGTFTLSHGISPSAAMIQIPPQDNFTVPAGTLAITYGGTRIEFPDCRLDMASLEVGDNGQIWTLKILDRRWKWQFGEISGHWNKLKPNKTLDPDREKSPQDLAKLLLDAMGEKRYDVSQLPNQTRPLAYWDCENPAEQLTRLCESLDCRVVLKLDNTVAICRNGIGQQLPGDRISGGGYGFDPVETPDSLKFVFGQTRWQMKLDLEAVGVETDGTIKLIKDLSYNPYGEGEPYGWCKENPDTFQGLLKLPTEAEVADANYLLERSGMAKVGSNGQSIPQVLGAVGEQRRKLAQSSVYKMYRVKIPSTKKMEIPEFGKIADYKQILPISDELLVKATPDDQFGKEVVDGFPLHQSARITGVFYDRVNDPALNINTPDGTRYTGSFSIDADRGIVTFSNPAFVQVVVGEGGLNTTQGEPIAQAGSIVCLPAALRLECTFTIQDEKTRVPVRHSIEKKLANGKFGTQPKIIKREDIVRTHRVELETESLPTDYGVASTTTVEQFDEVLARELKVFQVITNDEEVDRKAKYYIESEAEALKPKTNADTSYPYIRKIDPDGAICQVTWTVGTGGATTQASRNNEFNLSIPSYAERRTAELARRQREKVASTLDNQI